MTLRTAVGTHRGSTSALLLALALCALPRMALGQPASRPAGRIQHRPLPNYDGRGPPPVSTGQVAAWIPRVALFPLVLTIELIRRPLGALLTPPSVTHAFESAAGVTTDESAHGPRGPAFSIAPLVRLELDRRPEIGLIVGVDRLFAMRNRAYLSAGFGGERDYLGEFWDRVTFTGGDAGLRAVYAEHPDNPFYGRLGPDSRQSDLSRFWSRRAAVYATTSLAFGRIAGLFVQTGVRYTEVDLSTLTAESTAQGVDRYTAFATDAEAWFDTRGSAQPALTGMRAAVRLHHGADLARIAERRWVVAEAMAGAYLEVMHPGRVLGVEAHAALAEALGSDPVPFVELPTLGGMDPLRGFLEGRFRGQSTLAASVLYRWPVWIWLEAEMRLGVGNAFGAGFSGFRPGATFASWDVLLRTTPGGLTHFEMLFGAGSSRFDEPGFAIASGRVLFALTRSF